MADEYGKTLADCAAKFDNGSFKGFPRVEKGFGDYSPLDRNPLTDAPCRTNERHAGVVRLDASMIETMLKLPPGHRVVSVLVTESVETLYPAVRVIIEGPTMPVAVPGLRLEDHPLCMNADGSVQFSKP